MRNTRRPSFQPERKRWKSDWFANGHVTAGVVRGLETAPATRAARVAAEPCVRSASGGGVADAGAASVAFLVAGVPICWLKSVHQRRGDGALLFNAGSTHCLRRSWSGSVDVFFGDRRPRALHPYGQIPKTEVASIDGGGLQESNQLGAVLGRREPAIRLHVVAGTTPSGFAMKSSSFSLFHTKSAAFIALE